MAGVERVEICRVSEHGRETVFDVVISEAEILLAINGEDCRSLYCLPTHLEELTKGHLISEGVCHSSGMKNIKIEREGDRFLISATIDKCNPIGLNRLDSEMRMSSTDIRDAVKRLDERGVLFRRTGGAHVAEICDGRGSVYAEDVSRHCAIDKVIGLALQSRMDLTASSLVTSCRQTASTITKAIRCQIPIVITVSAPTNLAIETARKFGVTLIAFARGDRFNIYSYHERVTGA
jgi:FdhD protein